MIVSPSVSLSSVQLRVNRIAPAVEFSNRPMLQTPPPWLDAGKPSIMVAGSLSLVRSKTTLPPLDVAAIRQHGPQAAALREDGRLFEQGIRLAASPLRKAIILEGSSQGLADSGMRREALQGALITLTLFLGIPLLRSANAEETARLMLYAARQFDQIAEQSSHLFHKGKRPKGKRKTQLRILQSLPGIGPSTADKLLEHFGSVEAVLAADQQALLGVTGIGAGRAKAIRWAVGERLAGYGEEGLPLESKQQEGL